MKIFFTLPTILLAAFVTSLGQAAVNSYQFCQERRDFANVQNILLYSENRMSFKNHGGMANSGVCWWHNRFQRKAAYLAFYRPELPRPSQDDADELIEKIRKKNEVVVIPGFRNFKEFSAFYEESIQSEIEAWQRHDGILKFRWIRSLSGSTSVDPAELKKTMDSLYYYVNTRKEVTYVRLQLKGIEAHSWLIVSMKQEANGYKLTYIDSNYLELYEIHYQVGQSYLVNEQHKQVVPYLSETTEIDKMRTAISKFCGY